MASPAGRFRDAKRKLARAKKHLKALKACIADYSSHDSYKVIRGGTNGKKTIEVRITKPPPDISILAGEMIYQMRSALDHLAFALVERNVNSGTLPGNWDKNCNFPLMINTPKDKRKMPHGIPVPYAAFTKDLPCISQTAYAFLESVQPYYRKGDINNLLGFLADLSNVDKHRHLNVVIGRVSYKHTIKYASGLSLQGTNVLDPRTKYLAEVRTKSDRAVYVNRRFKASVSLSEVTMGGDPVTFPVDYLLKLMLEEIRAVILPAFETFLK